MKKLQILTLSLLSILMLTGCGKKSSSNNDQDKEPEPGPVEPEKSNFEKALLAVASYDIEQTNGFDYSLKQYLGRDETNSDVISLRADFSGSIKAKKVVTSKRLNEYGAGEQFTTTVETTYFSDNMICEYKNSKWKWSNYKKSEYFANAIANLTFDKSYLTSIKESLNEKYVLTADIPDAKVKDFLGADSSINNANVELIVSADFSNFESLKVSYFQQHTRSEMKFEVYHGSVSIDLPN